VEFTSPTPDRGHAGAELDPTRTWCRDRDAVGDDGVLVAALRPLDSVATGMPVVVATSQPTRTNGRRQQPGLNQNREE
jgi:hypothetical protein